jgi:tRNA threonylcarbamoyl adenosine modification protein YjeE
MEVQVPDLAALDACARVFALRLRRGSVVALHGALGAGKTTFVRALVRALHGSDAAVSSPTFVFRQRYDGEPPVEHLDLYRLDDPAELVELGLEDAFDADRITVVEWPERAPELIPAHAIDVGIAGSGAGPRTIAIADPSNR